MEGLVLRGGEGIPGIWGIWGVVMASIGVTFPEMDILGSATDGDCSGDCIGTCLEAEASIINGGSSGVVAKTSSRCPLSRFAVSTSMGVAIDISSLLSKTLLVGVGGI